MLRDTIDQHWPSPAVIENHCSIAAIAIKRINHRLKDTLAPLVVDEYCAVGTLAHRLDKACEGRMERTLHARAESEILPQDRRE
jgi:hypothetical protein